MRVHRRKGIVQTVRRRLYPSNARPYAVFASRVSELSRGASRILDVGCGHAAPNLSELNSGTSLKVGIDLDPDLRPAAAPSVRFVRATCECLPFCDRSFDLIISRSVLEHIEAPSRVFGELVRVLAPGGHCVFLVPNRWDYVSLLASMMPNRFHPWLVRVCTGRMEEDTFPTFYRANSPRRLKSLARNAGFEVVELSLLRENPHYLKFNSLAYLAGVGFEQVFQRSCRYIRPWIMCVLARDV